MFLFFACAAPQDNNAQNEEAVVEDTDTEMENVPLDLNNPVDNATAFIKMRGSLDETAEVVFYWHGYIYNHEIADPFASPITSYYESPILEFEGYNIARFQKLNDREYQMLSREITVYKNLFGNIIDCFDNYNIGVESPSFVPVVHVQNDPVNFVVGESTYKEMGGHVIWDMDLFLSYPSPLPTDSYPEYSAGDTYQSVEIFDFYSARADLEDPNQDSVPVHLTWVRHGQYLPWMQAGQKEGHLVYHGQGYKVMDGWDGLPEHLKEWTEENAPEYKSAPEAAIYGPNVTSWRYMKSLLDSDEYPSSCQ